LTERTDLLESIANTIADYREGEIPKPDSLHVDRWVLQFDAGVQLPILKEMDHVLKATYFRKADAREGIRTLLRTQSLVGDEACGYWKSVNFLDLESRGGGSQTALLELFSQVLAEECGYGVDACGGDGAFFYLDDAIFTGGTVGDDLVTWIKDSAPPNARLEVVVLASHTFGKFKVTERIERDAAREGKAVTFKITSGMQLENRSAYRRSADVLWPTVLPDDAALKEYEESQTYRFQPRTPGGVGSAGVFLSEVGRQILERELLMKGMFIRSVCQNPSPALRPLGFGPFGLGFGSTVVTYRNCPNNTPLALWWGDPDAAPTHPFSKWYPLLPRDVHEPTIEVDWDAMMEGL
jgi:hypothetical protein